FTAECAEDPERTRSKEHEGVYRTGGEDGKRRINHRGHRGTQRQGLYRRVRRGRGEDQVERTEGIYRNGREDRKRRINHRGHRGTQRQGLYRRVRRERGKDQIERT